VSPQRIQRKRTRGWRMPESAVYVGRPSVYGNPFRIGVPFCGPTIQQVNSAREAVDKFRSWLEMNTLDHRCWDSELIVAHVKIHGMLPHLTGKDLACWCPLVDDQGNRVLCHADVLLEVANGGQL
jgi:hypothetical protein